MGKRRSEKDLERLLKRVDHLQKDNPLPTDSRWRREVVEWIQRHGMLQEDLAKWCGTSQGNLSNMLNPANKNFRPRHPFVERVAVAIGMPLPMVARMELAAKSFDQLGADADADHAMKQLEALIEKLERERNN